jgi:hypothetical protein
VLRAERPGRRPDFHRGAKTMDALLKNGPLDGQLWPTKVSPDDQRISTRIGMGEKVVYDDTGEIDPVTGRRIFTYRPPKPKPVDATANNDQEDEADDE